MHKDWTEKQLNSVYIEFFFFSSVIFQSSFTNQFKVFGQSPSLCICLLTPWH
jgi:hypothetical protein